MQPVTVNVYVCGAGATALTLNVGDQSKAEEWTESVPHTPLDDEAFPQMVRLDLAKVPLSVGMGPWAEPGKGEHRTPPEAETPPPTI